MDEKGFLELFDSTLDRQGAPAKMEDEFRSFPEWDSLSLLAILAMANSEFSREIPRPVFEKMTTVRDLFAFLTKGS